MSGDAERSFEALPQAAMLILSSGSVSARPGWRRAFFFFPTACNYGESDYRLENSDILLLCQKDPFGELFSEIYFQNSSEFTFL